MNNTKSKENMASDCQSGIQKEIDTSDQLLNRLKYLVYAGGLLAIAVLSLYFYNFQGNLAPNHDAWGQFGDFIGGVLNPTFSFLALIALLSTIALQVRELRISARELSNSAIALSSQNETLQHQNFESSFFQLIRLEHDVVNGLNFESERDGIVIGRACFRFFYHKLGRAHEETNSFEEPGSAERFFSMFYVGYEYGYSHYFNLIYTILELVKRTDRIDKHHYTAILRAQLSQYEMQMIFYYCLSNWGARLKPFVEEFGLLKDFSEDQLPNKFLLRKYTAEAFGGEYPVSTLDRIKENI